MKIKGKKVKENIPDELANGVLTNTLRASLIDENEVGIDFGQITKSSDVTEINVVARLKMEPKLLLTLASVAFSTGLKYQKEYGISLGIPEPPENKVKNGGE